MKKIFLFLSIVGMTFALTAQNVHESPIKFGKENLSGYTLSIASANAELVNAALRERMEKTYGLKSSNEGKFRAYLNQPFAPFGTANYDIYYMVTESGKKGAKTAQLFFIVCSGNLNTITSTNDPETAASIKAYLNDLVPYIKEYSLKQQANTLQENLNKLQKTQKKLEQSMKKNQSQIAKLQKEAEKITQQQKTNLEEIRKIESDLNAVRSTMK